MFDEDKKDSEESSAGFDLQAEQASKGALGEAHRPAQGPQRRTSTRRTRSVYTRASSDGTMAKSRRCTPMICSGGRICRKLITELDPRLAQIVAGLVAGPMSMARGEGPLHPPPRRSGSCICCAARRRAPGGVALARGASTPPSSQARVRRDRRDSTQSTLQSVRAAEHAPRDAPRLERRRLADRRAWRRVVERPRVMPPHLERVRDSRRESAAPLASFCAARLGFLEAFESNKGIRVVVSAEGV